MYGTLVAVVARCGVWMPWYVMKTLREQKEDDEQMRSIALR